MPVCPRCGSKLSDVVATRRGAGGELVRKRRCFNEHVFFTEETVVDEDYYHSIENESKQNWLYKRKEENASR